MSTIVFGIDELYSLRDFISIIFQMSLYKTYTRYDQKGIGIFEFRGLYKPDLKKLQSKRLYMF